MKFEGTVNAGLLAESVITAPPAGAGPVRLKSSVAFAPLATVPGVIAREANVGRSAAGPPDAADETGHGMTVIVAASLRPL